MIFYKRISIYLIMIGSACFSNTSHAQEQLPMSPWTIGVDIGINIYLECGECKEVISLNSAFTSGFLLHYRLKKWFGLTGHLGYNRLQNYEMKTVVSNSFINDRPIYQRDLKFNYVMLSAGPKFIVRIGQGDLGLETRMGLYTVSANMNIISPKGEPMEIDYKRRFSGFTSLKIDYTYWPKPNFGVSLGFENLTDRSSNSLFVDSFEPKNSLSEIYPDANQEELVKLSPTSRGAFRINIVLGFTYRLN